MPNNRLLLGMACPKCGSEEPFFIQASCTVEVWDNHIDDEDVNLSQDFTWDAYSTCTCAECDYENTVGAFRMRLDISGTVERVST